MGQVRVLPILAISKVVRAEMIGIRSIEPACLIGFATVNETMVHADDDNFVKTEIVSYLQRCIGNSPAFMDTDADIATKASRWLCRVDTVSKCIFIYQCASSAANELHAVHSLDIGCRLFQHFGIDGHVVSGIEVKSIEAEVNFVHTEDHFRPEKAKIHLIEGRSIGYQYAALSDVAIVKHTEPVHASPRAVS